MTSSVSAKVCLSVCLIPQKMEHITLKIDSGFVAFLVLGDLAAAVPVVLAAFLAVFLAADFFAVFGVLTAGFLAAFVSSSSSHYPPPH